MTRRVLSIDIETFSSVDLTKSGAHAYAAAPDFEILLFGYAFDDEPVTVIDLAQGEELPREVLGALTDPKITKAAWNAAFERACIARHFSIDLDPDQWSCSMAHALYLGYPAALGEAAKVLDMPLKKDTAGRSLIRLFCSPGKPNLFSAGGRNTPDSSPDEWAQFVEYCRRDVEVEREIRERLSAYPLPEIERRVWAADQRINDRGIRVDLDLAARAIECDELSRAELLEEAERVTGLANPNSPAQLKAWIEARTGKAIKSLDKAAAGELIRTTDDPVIRRALELRLQLGKSSVAKYQAIERSACPDGRARGLMQYYGAARTGRWGGRRIQPQNLPRTRLRDLDAARGILLAGDYDSLDLLFGDTAATLSELIRTALIASKDHQLISADFSAIEARVLAWLAGEEWVLDVFRSGGGIYEATAAQMYRVPLDSIRRGHPLRERGKVATLACIAEGELILTHSGLIPIEEITTDHLVWDGVEFVAHGGVVFKGERETISYDGLTATPDHIVWIEGESRPVQLQEAAARGARLLQSGAGRAPVRVGEDYLPGKALHPEGVASSDGAHGVHRMRAGSMDILPQLDSRIVQGMPAVLATSRPPALARSEAHRGEAAMREPERPELPQLRGEGDPIQLPERDRSGVVDHRESRNPGSKFGDRSDRQQRALRAGKSSIRVSLGKRIESAVLSTGEMEPGRMAVCPNGGNAKTGSGDVARRDLRGGPESREGEAEKLARHSGKVRVYDIVNAGPRNRFTASGKLVHNCGYGGGVNALIAMGALRSGLEERELQPIVDQWRQANPRIVQYWRDVEAAALSAIAGRPVELAHGVRFFLEGDAMKIRLPSGRALSYLHPEIEPDPRFGKDSITYGGLGENNRWSRLRTYGGKLVENITQAVARDCLAEAILRVEAEFPEAKIVLHVHDEIVADVPLSIPTDSAIERIVELMAAPMPWAPDLPLDADAFATPYYRAD